VPIDTRSHLWLATVFSVAIHGVFLAALTVKSNLAPVYHPATYGVGSDFPVVQFVSAALGGSGGGGGVQEGDPGVPSDGLPSPVPPLVEMSENLPLREAQQVELLTVKISASQEAQLADDSATEILQKEPTAAGAIRGQSNTGGVTNGRIYGSIDGLGNGTHHGGVGSGRPGAGGSGAFGKPAYLRNPLPPYPRVAREHGWEGTTLLRVEVLDDGTGGKVEILKSSGYQVLDEAALETVRRWKFLPARSGDTPIRSLVEIPIRFRMAGN
jgi:periplasmic protein TonB